MQKTETRTVITQTSATSSGSHSSSTSASAAIATHTTEDGTVSRVDLNGTVYLVATAGVTAATAINDRVVINAGAHILEVQGGQLAMDGVGFGRVSSGDQVRLAADGTLTVNGERRHPQ